MVDFSGILTGIQSAAQLLNSKGNTATTSNTSSLAGSIFSQASNGATAITSGQTSNKVTDQDFEAFQQMAEKTTGKKLSNLSDGEYKAAMKAFIASKKSAAPPTPETKQAPAPEQSPDNKVDSDYDAYRKMAEKKLAGQEKNFMGTYETGYMKKSDYDKLTPEQQQNYLKDLKKTLSGE